MVGFLSGITGTLSGMITGTILGVYFAEKNLPFPIHYNKKVDQAGSIELDLQVLSTLKEDIVGMVGYNQSKNETASQKV